jgi:RimJ/RimL family protein N-acetyltransferase
MLQLKPMLKIEKIDENNKQRVIDSLKLDIVSHVFAFYDIQYDPKHTSMYAALENGNLDGYILIYTALDFPSVILECESETAESLIKYAPENNFIMHVPPNLQQIVGSSFPNAKCYVENWMLVKKAQANFFESEAVRRLCTEDDATSLAVLLSSRQDRPTGTRRKYLDLISRMPTYGAFMNHELVSYASSFLQLPEVWMMGGVYTNPIHRDKGYGTLTTSAVTKEALKHAESAALFVRSDNHPAIRVYEKIGYKKIGEKLWVDVGTGLRP